MKNLILPISIVAVLLALGGTAYAQVQNTITAEQALGVQNAQTLEQGLDTLQVTLNQLTRTQPADPIAVSMTLGNIRGTLLSINSTVAVLDGRARALAAGGTPGVPNTAGNIIPSLPNTGGGAAQE